jgi:hypothetical protein
MTYSAQALLSSLSVQNNISPLYAQYEQEAYVTMERKPPQRMSL